MGWRPKDVLECTAWEFHCAWLGWIDANSSAEPEAMGREELEEILKDYNPNER